MQLCLRELQWLKLETADLLWSLQNEIAKIYKGVCLLVLLIFTTMQLLRYFPLLATTLAAQAVSFIIIRSGSQYQFSSISRSGDQIIAGSTGEQLNFVLNDDGSLLDKNSGKYATISSNGDFTLGSSAVEGFSIDNENLEYSNKEEFGVSDDGKITFGGNTGGLGIALLARVLSSESTSPSTTALATTSTNQPASPSAAADGQAISVMLIRSGSQWQYATLSDQGGKVYAAGNGNKLDLILKNDGSLYDETSGLYVTVASSGNVTLGATAFKGFSILNGRLEYSNKESFGVQPDGQLVFGNNLGVGVALRVSTEASTPSSSTSTSAPTTSTATTYKPGEKFELRVVRSGLQLQLSAIKKVPSHPHVFSVGGDEGSDLVLTFSEDGTTLTDQDNRGVQVDSTTGEVGDVAPFGRTQATSGFVVKDGYLQFGQDAFYACPSGVNKFSLTTKSCEGGQAIALAVQAA